MEDLPPKTDPTFVHEGEGDPAAGSTLYFGIVSAVLMLAVVIFAVVLYGNWQLQETQRKVYDAPASAELLALRDAQIGDLRTPRWVSDKAVAIRIEDAIKLYVQRVQAGRPNLRPTTMPVAPGAAATTETP